VGAVRLQRDLSVAHDHALQEADGDEDGDQRAASLADERKRRQTRRPQRHAGPRGAHDE